MRLTRLSACVQAVSSSIGQVCLPKARRVCLFFQTRACVQAVSYCLVRRTSVSACVQAVSSSTWQECLPKRDVLCSYFQPILSSSSLFFSVCYVVARWREGVGQWNWGRGPSIPSATFSLSCWDTKGLRTYPQHFIWFAC